MPELELWSEDRHFGLKLSANTIQQIIKQCQHAYPLETGGVLVGHYTGTYNCALVTAASKAPGDSRSGHTWFDRGVQGLQCWLDQLWHMHQHYYLGEWHFHPGGLPYPSSMDHDQMQAIAGSITYHCPEPVLLIIGGDPAGILKVTSYVFTSNKPPIELLI